MPGTWKVQTSSSRMRSGRPFGRRTPRSAPPIGGAPSASTIGPSPPGGPGGTAGTPSGAGAADAANVRFIQGEIEALPLPDDSADVILSNGVPNLSPRKVRVSAEAFRVLRPGGRLALVDLVLDHDLPPEIATHPAA